MRYRNATQIALRGGRLRREHDGAGQGVVPLITTTVYCGTVNNIYFELTEAFNAHGPTVALASGQAVVFYRIAIMSKDGDWVIRETTQACERVLAELERRGAYYRPGAPLDVRWLAGGWSSHFEFFDERRRRVRCDFVSRPPRVDLAAVDALFVGADERTGLLAVDIDSLILMKRTQRAKDYAVIGELAALLPPEREIELTTNVDRILELAPAVGSTSSRPAVRVALSADRRAVVLALAEETDELQQEDRLRLAEYQQAAQPYLKECRTISFAGVPLRVAHEGICEMAERLLPIDPTEGPSDAHAERRRR